MMSFLKFKKMELGPIGTNAYLVWRDGSQEAVLIDAPPDSKSEVENSLKENDLILKEIWLTHGHWDHMAGASDLVVEPMRVLGHEDDKIMFEQPSIMSSFAIPGMEINQLK